jgi:ABC-2 type transport system permease protein
MNKMLLVFKHEFRNTIRRKGFIVLTILPPLLVLLGIGAYNVVSGITRPPAEVTEIGYVDEAGGFDQFLDQGNISLVPFDTTEAATEALVSQEIKEYFVIPSDFIATGVIRRYTTQRELNPPAATAAAIEDFISSNLLAGKVPEATITRIEAPLNLVTTTLTESGAVAPEQGGYTNLVIPIVFGALLAASLMFSSGYLLQGLGAEKENRLMEVLLSSVSPRQLVTGKVLGIGTAGLMQVAIWVAVAPLLLNLASSSIGGFFSAMQISPNLLGLAVVYFILGYLVFAVLSTGVAAVSSSVREAQTLASIFTLWTIAPFWLLSLIMEFPYSPAWVVLSIFPFSSPVMVILRLGLTGVPAWQLGTSIAVLVLCIFGGLVLSSKLLRTYVLMYGKRPTFGEVIRNLRRG